MCVAPIQINKAFPSGRCKSYVVPCGHCPECRASYQSKFAALSVLECMDHSSVAFVTLTYDQDNLPVALTDPRRKDRLHAFQRGRECSPDFLEKWRTGGCTPLLDDADFIVCPSLYREDVKNLLKRFRASHPGLRLRFASFGEYGEQFHRPHYHLLLYGLDNVLADEFCKCWKFGFTNYSVISAFNPDGSSGFNAVSSYVSKYVGKGDRLPRYVRLGFAEKPRRQSSLHFGLNYVVRNKHFLEDFILPGTATRAID